MKRFLRLPCATLAALWISPLALACDPGPKFLATAFEPGTPAPRITATNWDGQPFDSATLRGRAAIVFFGFTSCPDICPQTFAKLGALPERLGERAAGLAVVFVSVDPERDSLERLAAYVQRFQPEFYGLRLEGPALQNLLSSFGVAVQRRQSPEEAAIGYYSVDHTSRLFVIDRAGDLRLSIEQSAPLDDITADIVTLLTHPAPGDR